MTKLFLYTCKRIFGVVQIHLAKQWKRINHKQITRWQHLSRLKASAFLFETFLLGVKKYNNLYLRLVMPSSGRKPIDNLLAGKAGSKKDIFIYLQMYFLSV